MRPSYTIVTEESLRDYSRNHYKGQRYKYKSFATYPLLKKELAKDLALAVELPVSVSRSRRGEWGEWFEHWQVVNGKPTIVKAGWM